MFFLQRDEIGSFLRSKYQALMNKTSKIFPIDVINLDYDGNISKNHVPISETIELIFKCQALHQKNFSLFITWPHTEAEDEQTYKDSLKKIIEDNLEDPQAKTFKTLFDQSHTSVANLDYERLSIIGLSKIIIQHSSTNKFNLHKNEFFIYGEKNRRRMFSILMNFNFQNTKSKHILYSGDVHKALDKVTDLSIT